MTGDAPRCVLGTELTRLEEELEHGEKQAYEEMQNKSAVRDQILSALHEHAKAAGNRFRTDGTAGLLSGDPSSAGTADCRTFEPDQSEFSGA